MRKSIPGLLILAVCCVASRGARAESLLAYSKDDAIYTASAANGKNARKVCTGSDPCISGDGRFLAYTRNNKPASKKAGALGTRSLVVRELSSGKETDLPAGGAEQVYGALWSADDRWIAFNTLTAGKSWQVGVVRPDGSDSHVLTESLPGSEKGCYLAGWNLHDGAVLVHDLVTITQLDPVKGNVAWRRSIKEVNGNESTSSAARFSVSPDGKRMLSSREVETDEFKNLDGPSSYLVLTELPGGPARRITPVKFDALNACFEASGETAVLRGFGEKDVTPIKGGDGVRLKFRIYRLDIRSGKLTPLVEGDDYPSVSRG